MITRTSVIALAAIAATTAHAGWTATDITPPGNVTASAYAADPDGLWAGNESTSSFGGQAIAVRGSNVTVLPFAGSSYSVAFGIEGAHAVGGATVGFNFHPVAWNLHTLAPTDLTPTGFTGGAAQGIDDGTAVGYALDSANNSHAYVWDLRNNLVLDLTPHTALYASANGVHDGVVVGAVDYQSAFGSTPQAVYWLGHHMFSLHPTGATTSSANAVATAYQAGNVDNQAAIWHGTPGSYQNITPTGALGGNIVVAAGSWQGGTFTDTNNRWQAALWHGSKRSFVNLSAVLPAGYVSSAVWGLVEVGNSVVVYGLATDSSFTTHAFKWVWRR